ncbi:AfsR/SARP family transcriptional regulator [Geodermatophilus sp. SYSU D01176]
MSVQRVVAREGPPARQDAVLHLLAGPYVTVEGRRRELPDGSKRMLVFVALHRGDVSRRALAGTLWPECDAVRAAGNLRSALWRLRGAGVDLVDADPCTLRLRAGTVVDLQVLSDWATRLTEGRAGEDDLRTGGWRTSPPDLLPGWDEDWVVFERERLRQRQVHGLEALCRLLVRARRYAEAVEAGLAAVEVDPLRESARHVLCEAHLAEGNPAEAVRAFETYRRLLGRELGVRPGRGLAALVATQSRRRAVDLPRPRPASDLPSGGTGGPAGRPRVAAQPSR